MDINSNIAGASEMGPAERDQLLSHPALKAETFDYSSLTVETAQELRLAVTRIRGIQRSAIADVGDLLIAAKKLLEHGDFSGWAQAELGMAPRSAERYMSVSRWLEGKPPRVAHLPLRLLCQLAAPSAPAVLVEEVVTAAAAGSPLAAEMVRARLELVAEKRRTIVRMSRCNDIPREEAERRYDAKYERDARAADKAEDERRRDLFPLAGRLHAALSGPDCRHLMNAQEDYRTRQTLTQLLNELMSKPKDGDPTDAVQRVQA